MMDSRWRSRGRWWMPGLALVLATSALFLARAPQSPVSGPQASPQERETVLDQAASRNAPPAAQPESGGRSTREARAADGALAAGGISDALATVRVVGPGGEPVLGAHVESQSLDPGGAWTARGKTTARGLKLPWSLAGSRVRAHAPGWESDAVEAGRGDHATTTVQLRSVPIAQDRGVTLSGRVHGGGLAASLLHVRLAHCSAPVPDAPADEGLHWMPGLADRCSWSRGPMRPLSPSGAYLAPFLLPEGAGRLWRVEVWCDPLPNRDAPAAPREAMLVAFSQPIVLSGGERCTLEDLPVAAMPRLRVEITKDCLADALRRGLLWRLLVESPSGATGPEAAVWPATFEPWPRAASLELPVTSYWIGCSLRVAFQCEGSTSESASIVLGEGRNVIGPVRIAQAARLRR
ncbi:MAG: hypothetical protein EYC70_12925 [Planctomycetota bacterium]|nr:MAG: hypothetical protein EYC70_12925 [Planctomycetota bacterium]